MIEMPAGLSPNSATVDHIDFGLTLRPANGARILRIDRMGNRFAIELGWAPMEPDKARTIVSRLISAQSQGLRVTYPLLGVSQGAPGAPVVNGAGQAGKTLLIRGLTPRYALREGFWLNLVDDVAAGDALGDGTRYLHNCRSNVAADAAGAVEIEIEPAMRAAFADGATIVLAKPTIEGLPVGDRRSWELPVGRRIALSVPLEEIA